MEKEEEKRGGKVLYHLEENSASPSIHYITMQVLGRDPFSGSHGVALDSRAGFKVSVRFSFSNDSQSSA